MGDGATHQALNAVHHLRTSPRDPNGEPQFRSLADPPGKSLVQAYLQHETDSKAVLYVEVPSTEQRPSGKAWLLKVLLRATDDPEWNKQEASYTKEIRLKDRLKRETELVIVADIHHLAQEPQHFDLLLSVFQTDTMMPLLIVGEPTQMRQLLMANARFTWRFQSLRY
ncbi:hypothetical protein ccbrp13_71300 [Ktedonobacteria bacterium brp13]|nr:hypothetical protein ccbrp13_71300 [Ktedonobacteria bacterium brp13]